MCGCDGTDYKTAAKTFLKENPEEAFTLSFPSISSAPSTRCIKRTAFLLGTISVPALLFYIYNLLQNCFISDFAIKARVWIGSRSSSVLTYRCSLPFVLTELVADSAWNATEEWELISFSCSPLISVLRTPEQWNDSWACTVSCKLSLWQRLLK